jgi:hypothetical protein
LAKLEEGKIFESVNGAIEKLWVDGYITAAHALAGEASAKFPDKPEFAESEGNLKLILDAMSGEGDPNALPDIIPQ